MKKIPFRGSSVQVKVVTDGKLGSKPTFYSFKHFFNFHFSSLSVLLTLLFLFSFDAAAAG